MDTAEQLTPSISEPLTWAQIRERYPDEWVCLVEMDRIHPHGFDFRTARVVGHGKTRREPFEQAAAFEDKYAVIGHYFTGRIAYRGPRPTLVLDDETRDAIFGRS
jgi:hypothetical protein